MMWRKWATIAIITLPFFVYQNCSDVEFGTYLGDQPYLGEADVDQPGSYKKSQIISFKSLTQTHEVHYTNELTASFKGLLEDGSELTIDHLEFFENGNPITNYRVVSAESEGVKRKIDLVFVIDSTGSMASQIQSVILYVKSFVDHMAENNISARLCLVTYKDWVERECTMFHDDDPETEENENLNRFKSDLSSITASGGGAGTEDTLGGILSAANKTPWDSDSHRMIIVINDRPDFWYAPTNLGETASYNPAPSYSETLEALVKNKVQSFLVTRSGSGLNSSFGDQPAIPTATNGKFYDFQLLSNSTLTIEDVFSDIADMLSTTFTIKYLTEENGLDPLRPIADRTFEIKLKDGTLSSTLTTQLHTFTSNLTSTSGSLFPSFIINGGQNVVLDSVKVSINGVELNPSDYSLANGSIDLKMTPEDYAKIKIEFVPENRTQAIIASSIPLAHGVVEITDVRIDEFELGRDSFRIEYGPSGEAMFNLNVDKIDDNLFQKLIERGSLEVALKYTLKLDTPIPRKLQ